MSASITAAELQGDPEAGKTKSVMCLACHGADGNSSNPVWPKIAGQGQRYFIKQILAFKQGPKGDRRAANAAQMYGMVASLSEQEIANLAAYFSAQKITVGVAADELVKKGEVIYRGGDSKYAAAACIACHGPSGEGNPAAGFPALSGQHAEYTYSQLLAFQQGLRTGDVNNSMQDMVRKMSKEEMRAVAEYIQGLH